jgi:N utilization substance protein A
LIVFPIEGEIRKERTMSKEILLVVDSVSNEKGVSREVIFQALEQALVAATKKNYNTDEIDLRVAIDRKTGDYDTFRRWTVVADEDHEIPAMQLAISDVEGDGMQLGDVREEQVRLRRVSAVSLRRPPSRSSCRRCARQSAPWWWTPIVDRIGEILSGVVKKDDA